MDALTYIRSSMGQSRNALETTMTDVTSELAHWVPDGKAAPIGAQYAHVITAEDFFVHGVLKGEALLAASAWAGRTGLSIPPPPGRGWGEWARDVRIDLPALRAYAQAVRAATDAYVASLTADDLNRKIDPPMFGPDSTVASILNLVAGHPLMHAGEISAIKGMRGLTGYGF